MSVRARLARSAPALALLVAALLGAAAAAIASRQADPWGGGDRARLRWFEAEEDTCYFCARDHRDRYVHSSRAGHTFYTSTSSVPMFTASCAIPTTILPVGK